MVAVGWSQDARGRINADMIVPRDIPDRIGSLRSGLSELRTGFRTSGAAGITFGQFMDDVRMKLGLMSTALYSGSQNLINWGKNTQWAGRQLMVGLTIPFVAFAAGSAAMAYTVDKEMTRVLKVYDYTTSQASDKIKEFANEQNQLKQQSMTTTKSLAQNYGQNAKDSLNILAELAATGKTGVELQKSAAAVSRARFLGELDLQDALKATITLQTVYKKSGDELNETFAFMNAIENSTVLSMQDFVVGLPRVGGVLKELGGDVKDVAILMVGMKAAGIDAAEGANALKSISFRAIAASNKGLKTFSDLTGKDLHAIINETNASVIPTLIRMAEAMQGLNKQQKVQVAKDVFGIYQGSKALALMEQLLSESDQISRANKVAQQSTQDWLGTANREVEAFQNSASGKLKRAFETIRVELAAMGEPFLEVVTDVVGGVTKMLKWFNSLPEGVKKFALISLAIMALVGPTIMIIGIFGNFIGQILRLVGTIGLLATRFKLVNPEQRLQQLLANQTSLAWRDQATSAQLLNLQLAQLSNNLRILANTQYGGIITGFGNATNPDGTPAMYGTATPNLTQDANGRLRRSNGQFASSAEIAAWRAAQNSSSSIASTSNTIRKNWTGTATAIGMAAGFLGTMATQSGTTANNIAMMAFIGASLLPVFGQLFSLEKIKPWFAGVTSGLNGVTSRFAGLGAKLASFGSAIMGWIGPIALVGTVVAFAWYAINKSIKDAEENAAKAADTAKSYADILGYTYIDVGQKIDEQGQAVDTFTSKVQKFAEANKEAAKKFSDMREATINEKIAVATEEALKVRIHGGTIEAAQQAARIALDLMGEKFSDKEFDIKIKPQINLTDSSILDEQINVLVGKIDDAANNNMKISSKGERFARTFIGDYTVSKETAKEIQASAKELWTYYANMNEQQKVIAFNKIKASMNQDLKAMYEDLQKNHADFLKKYNINSYQDFLSNATDANFRLELGNETTQEYSRRLDAYRNFVDEWARLNNITDKETINNIKTMDDLGNSIGLNMNAITMSVADAASSYESDVREMERAGNHLSDAQKLNMLNTYRRAAGLQDATSVEQGFSDAVDKATDAVKNQSNALNNNRQIIGEVSGSAEDFSKSLQDIYSGTMNDIYGEAQDIMQQQHEAQVDSIEKTGDARLKQIDAREKALGKQFDVKIQKDADAWDAKIKRSEDIYDARIKKINDAIQAEKDAEEQRQKIFDQEKERIQQLADLYNKRVDFNTALNSGSLDEAAKINNDIMAAQQQNSLGGASDASKTASDARVAALQNQAKSLEDQKQKQTELYKKQKELSQKALNDQKEKMQEELAARKEKVNAEIAAEKDAANRIYNAKKKALEQELATLKAFVPRNESELRAHIARIQQTYAKYGVDLQAQGYNWSRFIASALQNNINTAAADLRNKIAWAQIAADIAEKMAQGAFGMTLDEFKNWVATGQLPQDKFAGGVATTRQGGKPITQNGKIVAYQMPGGGRTTAYHTGGLPGRDKGSRIGYTGGIGANEKMALIRNDEYIVNANATRRHLGLLDAINSGIPMDSQQGPGGKGGALLNSMVVGMISGFAGAIKTTMQRQMGQAISASNSTVGFTGIPGKPGRYGGADLNAEQLANAAKIIAVGKSMGASRRDLTIALMTALQESSLRNLSGGDRDSVGLFQQRPSMGWGSVAQLMDPNYSSRKFFEKELKVKNRESLPLYMVAQAVQRSAIPLAYAKWQDEAEAILSSTGLTAAGGGLLNMNSGGWIRPAAGRISSGFGWRVDPINGSRALHDGIDIANALGTPIYAAHSGIVSRAGVNGGFGNYVELNHGGGIATGYGHLSRIFVTPGQQIRTGQNIAAMGSTGRSTGSHLHLRYRVNGTSIDPRPHIPGLAVGGNITSDGIARLHKNEMVTTAPLTAKLKAGINKLDETTNIGYNSPITLKFYGPVSSELDIEKAVQKAMNKVEENRQRKLGLSRKVS